MGALVTVADRVSISGPLYFKKKNRVGYYVRVRLGAIKGIHLRTYSNPCITD